MVVFYLIVRALRQCLKLQHYTKLGNGDFVSKFVKRQHSEILLINDQSSPLVCHVESRFYNSKIAWKI